MNLNKLTKRCSFMLGAALLAGSVNAAETLKWAHVYEVSTPYHQAALNAAKEFEAATDGRYEVKVYPASSLGKEAAINEGLGLGTVDIIYTGLAFAASSYGPISVSDYPFTLRSYDHWEAYRDSNLFQELSAGYSQATGGNIIAGLTYYGSRQVTSNKPILKPGDMKGLKIRVPNAPAYLMFPKATGANPTPMAFSEVYLALQQGVVDAQENPLPTIKFKKFYEVQSNINLTGHITNSLITVLSPRLKKKLSSQDLATLKKSISDAADGASEEIRGQEKQLVGWMRSQGVTVNEVDRQPFMEAVKPALTGKGLPFSKEVYDRLQAIEG